MGPFQILLFVVWAVSAVALTILVLMHSGKGTGVSDMIASSLYNSSSATAETAQTTNRRIWNGPIDKLLNRTIQTPVLYHNPQHSPNCHLGTG